MAPPTRRGWVREARPSAWVFCLRFIRRWNLRRSAAIPRRNSASCSGVNRSRNGTNFLRFDFMAEPRLRPVPAEAAGRSRLAFSTFTYSMPLLFNESLTISEIKSHICWLTGFVGLTSNVRSFGNDALEVFKGV